MSEVRVYPSQLHSGGTVAIDFSYQDFVKTRSVDHVLSSKFDEMVVAIAEQAIRESGVKEAIVRALPPPTYTGAGFYGLMEFLWWLR